MRITEADMDKNTIIKGERIYLRPFSEQDIEDHVKILSDWNVTKWLSNSMPYPYSTKDGEIFLKQSHEEFQKGNTVRFAIIDKETDRLMGGIKIFSLKEDESEIGYWLAQQFWGKGYGSDVLRITIEWIKLASDVKILFALTANDNKGSRRILEKVGFAHKGAPPDGRAKCGHGVTCSEYYVLPLIKE